MTTNLDHARCFCTLVESGSYQAAAKAMHRSHSAIVYGVSLFEQQTGLKLLNRKGYRTTLTADGRRVYQQTKSLLESVGDLEHLCADLIGGWEPSIRVVYDGVLSSEPFLATFRQFKSEKVPTVLDIYSDYLMGVERLFDDLKADIMISVLPAKQSHLVMHEANPLSLLLVAQKNHEISRRREPWSVNELKMFNFFTVRGADRSLNLGTKELEETSTFHVSDFMLKKTAIMQGFGFGWLPEYLIADEIASGALKLVRWEYANRRELHPKIYFRRRPGPGRAGQLILDRLRRAADQD